LNKCAARELSKPRGRLGKWRGVEAKKARMAKKAKGVFAFFAILAFFASPFDHSTKPMVRRLR